MRRGIALLALLQSMAPAIVLAQDALPEPVSAMMRKAADRDVRESTTRYLDAAVQIAIDTYPNRQAQILAQATALAPARSNQLAALTGVTGTARVPVVIVDPPPQEPQVSADEKTVAPASKAAVKAAPPKPSGFLPLDGWKGGVELGAALNTGNVSSQSVATAVNMQNDREDWRHKVGGTFGLIKTDGVTTRERVTASYQLDYKFSERLYSFGLLQYERDRFSSFNDRYLESLGVGYRVLQGERVSLDLEGSAALRQSTLTETLLDQDEVGGRVNTIFNWTVSDTFAINNTGTAFVSDLRTSLENTVSLKTKITPTISGKLSFNVKHDTDVPWDAERTSTETKATLLYSF